MGYYKEQLAKIEAVEAQGFDPYTELYTSRVGQLQTPTPDVNPNISQPQVTTPTQPTIQPNTTNATQPINVSDVFTTGGFDDPYDGVITTDGNINFPKFTKGYNDILENPELAKKITPEQYIEMGNTRLRDPLEKEYGEGNSLVVDPDTKTLSVSKPKEENINYRFEIGKRQGDDPDGKFKRGDPIYYRWDDKGNYITYPDKNEYDKALKEYKSIEDLDVDNIPKKAKK